MTKGRRLDVEEIKNIANGITRVICVSQSGYETMCVVSPSSLEDVIYDIKNRFCKIYLSE